MRTDLISRNKLHTTLQRQAHRVIDDREYVIRDAVLEKISMAPSVDAVEVVRCKNCKCNYGLISGEGWLKDDIVCTYWSTDGLPDDGFCHYGARMDTKEATT